MLAEDQTARTGSWVCTFIDQTLALVILFLFSKHIDCSSGQKRDAPKRTAFSSANGRLPSTSASPCAGAMTAFSQATCEMRLKLFRWTDKEARVAVPECREDARYQGWEKAEDGLQTSPCLES